MTTVDQLPAVLTVEEAAATLRIGRSAAYDAIRRGELPAIRVGRILRVPRHRLEQMLGIQEDDEPVGNGLEVTTLTAGVGDGRAPR